MAKAPVLGNDPFQRGAAERPAPQKPPAPEPAAPTKPAKAEAAPAARARPAAAARKTKGAAAKSAPKAAPAAPLADAAAKTRTARPAPAKRQRAAAPTEGREAAAAVITPPPAPEPASAPAPAVTPEPEPAAAPGPPATAAERESERFPAEPEPQGATAIHVLEGELIEEPPHRPLLLPGGRHGGTAEHAAGAARSAADFDAEPGWLERTRQGVVQVLAGTLRASLESAFARRVSEAVSQMPLMQRALGSAAGAAAAAAPAYAFAARHLPPAVGAARSAVSAIVSGQAARTLAATAAEAGDAARRIARRVEPPTFEVDPFGEDERLASRLEPLFDFLHDRYFRIEALGTERVPPRACLLVCNHSGALPLDGPMIRTVLRRDCDRPDARWLIEDALFHAPFMGVALNRLGAVRACPENAQRLLDLGVALAVFPEGLLGISKPLGMRYRLQRFGRGGFVKVALRAGVPIVPVAIVGAEESSPLLARIPVRSLGLPYLPITTLPLPARWTVSFLPPVDLSAHGREAVEDPAVISRRTAEVREAIQQEIDRLIERRRSLLTG